MMSKIVVVSKSIERSREISKDIKGEKILHSIETIMETDGLNADQILIDKSSFDNGLTDDEMNQMLYCLYW